LLLACAALLCARSALALDPSLDISQYAHTAWRVRDGFTQGTILAIAQTPDGYLWMGTDLELVRFDGVRAVPWQPPPGQQLPSKFIWSLAVARDGTLWIGTKRGIASWKDGKLTTYPEIAGRETVSILEDHEGTIWVGEWQAPQGRLCAIRNGAVECYGADGSFGRGALSLYEDSKGKLWVGSVGGFWRWKPDRPKFYSLGTKNTAVTSFAEDIDGALLIAAEGMGIWRLVDGAIEEHPYTLPNSAPGLTVYRLLKDQDGALWIGIYGGGLVHVHQPRTDVLTQSEGLSGNSINAVFQDREGSIWVATTDGLDRFRNFAVPRWSVQQGLPFAPGGAVLAARDGSVWAGSSNGLGRLSKSEVTIYRQARERGRSLTSQAVRERIHPEFPKNFRALLQDHNGRIWVSSPNGGLGYFENQQYHPVSSVGTNASDALAEDANGDLWVAGREDGLFRLHDEKVIEKTSWDTLGRKDFGSRLAVDHAKGGLWISYRNGGITYFADGKLRASYSDSDGLGHGVVNDLRFGPRGTLWAATEGGLSRIRDGYITTLTIKNGLPCDTVHWSMEDDEHFVWLYMACGLVRIARSELDAWVADPKHVVQTTILDVSDGLRNAASPTGNSPQVSKAPDGRILFVELDGIGMIDPQHLPYNKVPPPVHIEQITADGRAYDAARGPLPPLVRDLTIDYTALSLVVPEKVRFRVKLEGQDEDWRELTDRSVNYTNLAPKHYRFMVKACNNSGVWNEEGAALDFVIPPSWYQTNWFRSLCVATFFVMLWGLYRLRVLQLAREFNAGLEARVNERTRIARELHDTLLQSFHGLLLRFQTVSNLLPASDAKQALDSTIDQAAQAITEGRDAVQELRPSTLVTSDLAVAVSALGHELATAETSEDTAVFRVTVEGASRNLHTILRDDVYRIAAEAIRNAFKHAHARQIEVEIRYDERQFRVRVRDDGKGIDPTILKGDELAGHFGLHGLHERAELIGGKVTVWSERDSGTEVELSIPASNAYEKSSGTKRFRLAEKLSGKFSGKGTAMKS